MMLLNLAELNKVSQSKHTSNASDVDFAPDGQRATPGKTPDNILLFVDNIGKKLRSEINAMIGFSQMTKTTNTQQQQSLDMVEKLGCSLIDFIDAIKVYWQIETKSYTLSSRRFRLNSLIDAIKAQIRPQTSLNGSCLQVCGDRDLPEFLLTDPHCLRQALLALISNALTQSERSSIRLHVSALRMNLKDYLRFELSGFNLPSAVDQNCDPFQWRWNDFDVATDMTWLASVLAAKKIRLLGGSLRVADQANRQGVLTIDLPRLLPERDSDFNQSHSTDQILKQVTKNYSAVRHQRKADSQKHEATNYTNSDIYLG